MPRPAVPRKILEKSMLVAVLGKNDPDFATKIAKLR
jgi:hypothetical protein